VILVFLVVTVATWTFGLIDAPRAVIGDPLVSTGFGDVPKGWSADGESANVSVDGRGVILGRAAAGRSLARRTVLLPPGRDRRLRVRAAVETLVPPPFEPNSARALLTTRFSNEAGELVGARALAEASRLRGVVERDIVFDVPDEARALDIVFTNRNAETRGRFRLSRIVVESVGPATKRNVLNALMVLSWLALLAVTGVTLLRRTGPRVASAVAMAFTFVAVGVMLPESATGGLATIRDAVVARVPALEHIALLEVFKVGHFLVFFLLGMLMFRFRGRLGMTRMHVIGLLLLLALASEGAQLYLDNRTPRPTDLLIDGAGILLAALLFGNRQRRRLPS